MLDLSEEDLVDIRWFLNKYYLCSQNLIEHMPVSNFHFQSQLIKSNIMEILKKNNILTLILFIVNRVYILMQLKNN
jgi:hypothetical protein